MHTNTAPNKHQWDREGTYTLISARYGLAVWLMEDGGIVRIFQASNAHDDCRTLYLTRQDAETIIEALEA